MTCENNARILVADDHPLSRELLRQMLEHLGAEADFAADGEEAVDMAGRADYRLILMDVKMPQMNGLEAALRIRGRRERPQPCIVAITACAFGSERDGCREAGMNAVLVKPFKLEELRRVLAACLPDGAGGDCCPL
ncbi:response regulator [Chromobacterium subtsugae]|mgnify:CR=1 FL=1|uniref:Response regulator n=2 Tax=Chromobacterium subtsugae TaxID=251747 RepID=A0ABS7FIX5_9NEIS|nr:MULTISPECIES: response regulator [Chromobacterium]KUM05344.1 hypothetical protein Cv017_09630 [Chromobacterium subtsugae]KZE84713.1 hypothetical protein AWB61_04780 [Chromobacterium sp. F49]MBW7567460.1 response regulator [Chromobacterium subtsugae]MBW8289666.1 response regulator [Chromobacterium subtsugae]WSE90264.1 response regulator [Chromobacterium subtsugae]